MMNKSDEIIIRKWTAADFASIREILRVTWIDTYVKFIPESDLLSYLNETYNDDKLNLLLQNLHTMFYMADVNSTTSGIMRVLNNINEKRFYLNSLYVLPEYQGFGVGKKLSLLAEKIATELGHDKIWLGVMEQNISSVEWYKKLGYIFPEKEPFKMGNTIVNHFIGYKTITESI